MTRVKHVLLSLLTGLLIFGSFYLMIQNEARKVSHHRHNHEEMHAH